jgi:hypothetical protein
MQTSQIQSPSLTSSLATTVTSILAGPPASTWTAVSAITFCNKSGASCWVTCSIYNGTTDFYLAWQTPILPNDTLVLGGVNLKVLLANGFSLRALAQTAAAIDVTVSSVQFS